MRDFFGWTKQFDWLSIEQVSEMPVPEVLKVGDFFFYLITTPCNIVNIGYTLQPLELLTGLAGNSKNEKS